LNLWSLSSLYDQMATTTASSFSNLFGVLQSFGF